ncbi:FecR family protein [Sphingobium chlorophenolicum]|uniref:Putative FecR n=1 Tax=Sphingobium chlorophenolicum TaxID=46429 RepID=A0A081RAG3_SPHCR|nr:FecR domain-containing protein [Sphingobium chlorophenolicum]KEQ52186.1 putative FecR [Sphingobium chlorophenolicum]
MTFDEREARRSASHWYVRLREEPDDDAVNAAFEEWLAADVRHAEAWVSMSETVAAAGRAPPELRTYTIPPRADPAAIPTRRRSRSTGWRWRARPRVAAAAAAAACAALLAFPQAQLYFQADHSTSVAQVEQVRLADGSSIQLGPASAVAVDFDGKNRTVRLLAGQALFDVVHDPSRPFRVESGAITTTVLGTSFEVRTLGDNTEVAVRRGHVRVEDANASPASRRELLAGDWVRINQDHTGTTGKIATELVGGWRRGDIMAENRTVASVIDEIRPWYRGAIVVTDSALAARAVTGIYNVHDPVKALRMIVNPYGGTVTRITPWLMVVSGA